MQTNVRIHPTADVSDKADIGEGTAIWHYCHIREDVHIGTHCILGRGVYVDFGVHLGNNVKVQNYVSIYHGVEIEDGVLWARTSASPMITSRGRSIPMDH
jgi:UDP-3-O-[3-hydroxymyristoyl] glucosamine N-acyltransferase